MWLHHPDNPAAVSRGDQYFFGRDLLIAPVVEKGAASRRLYLPAGSWFDFWTEERVDGGRELDRAVDLSTVPIYVRAGAIVPMGPVKQFTSQPPLVRPIEVRLAGQAAVQRGTFTGRPYTVST